MGKHVKIYAGKRHKCFPQKNLAKKRSDSTTHTRARARKLASRQCAPLFTPVLPCFALCYSHTTQHKPQAHPSACRACCHGSPPPSPRPLPPRRLHRPLPVSGRRALLLLPLRRRRPVPHCRLPNHHRHPSPFVVPKPHLHFPRRLPLPLQHQAHLPGRCPRPGHRSTHIASPDALPRQLPAAGHRAGNVSPGTGARHRRAHIAATGGPAGSLSPGARPRAGIVDVPSGPCAGARRRRRPGSGAEQEAQDQEARGPRRVPPLRRLVADHRPRPRPRARPLRRRHVERRGARPPQGYGRRGAADAGSGFADAGPGAGLSYHEDGGWGHSSVCAQSAVTTAATVITAVTFGATVPTTRPTSLIFAWTLCTASDLQHTVATSMLLLSYYRAL